MEGVPQASETSQMSANSRLSGALDELARLLRESPAEVLTAVAGAWDRTGRPWVSATFTQDVIHEIDFTEHQAGHDDRGVSREARARAAELTLSAGQALCHYVQHFDGAVLYDGVHGTHLFEEVPDPWPSDSASPHRWKGD
jgi:hypothetical protein